MRIAYVRVSTEEQNEARQREALKQYRIEKWFCEKRSAKDTNRPQLEARKESRLQKERSGIRGGSVFSSQIALNYYMEGIGITKLQNLKLQGSWRLVARR